MLNYNQIAFSWEGRGHVSRAQTFVFHGRQCVMGQVGFLKYALRVTINFIGFKGYFAEMSILFALRASLF